MNIKKSIKYFAATFLWATLMTCGFITHAQEHVSSEGYIKTSDGLRLFYRIDGNRGDPVVVLHGGPGMSMSSLRPDLLNLSQERTIIFYDQRGSGRSTVASEKDLLSISNFIEDLDLLRQHFKIKKLTLLGHSWGTGLAALYSIKYPDRVKEMILVGPMEIRSTPYTEQFLSNGTKWMDEDTKKKFFKLIDLRNKANDVSWCNEFYSILFTGYFSDPSKMSKMKGNICEDPPKAILNNPKIDSIVIEELGDWDWRKPLKKVNARTLVVYGSDDVFPIESAQEWAEYLPNAQLMVIPESGHFPYVEQPEIFFNAVKDFLQGSWPANSIAVR